MVTGGFSEKTPKIWGSFAKNFVYNHFQQPKCDAKNALLNLICTEWKDLKFICGVKVSYKLNSAILRFHTPVFRRDVLWYGDVRPGLRPSDSPSVRPSGSPSVRPPVFRTFLLHTLTYWAEILHVTLFWCTTDQVRLSSLCVNFRRSYASLWT